jgi:cell shape-determining protein MreC
MSFALANEMKAFRNQLLELLKRIEALEDFNEEAKRRRPILTLPKTEKAANVQSR